MIRLRPWQAWLALLFSLGFFTFAHADDLPNLSLQTKQGGLHLNELRGQVVYLDFWASWCVPCRKSFPWMNDMHKRYGKDGLKIVAINLDKEVNLAKQFLTEYPANFTVAYDPEGLSAEKFKVQAMPSSFLIDKQGKLHSTHLGFKDKDTAAMEAEITKLLAK